MKKLVIAGFVAATTVLTGCDALEDRVEKVVPVGTFLSSDFQPESFSSMASSKVVTSKGVFYVKGRFSSLFNENLELRTHRYSGTSLCAKESEFCKPVFD